MDDLENKLRAIPQERLTEAFLSRAPTLAAMPRQDGWYGDQLVVPQLDGSRREYRRGKGYALIRAEKVFVVLAAAAALGAEVERHLYGHGVSRSWAEAEEELRTKDVAFAIAVAGIDAIDIAQEHRFHHLLALPHLRDDDGMIAINGVIIVRMWGQAIPTGPTGQVARPRGICWIPDDDYIAEPTTATEREGILAVMRTSVKP